MDPRGLSDNEVVTLTIFGEARGEPIEGQVAVGSVIRNRLHSNPDRYKSFKDVCLERNQFSTWNMNDVNRGMIDDISQKLISGQVINDPYFRQCALVAQGILSWALIDNTKGALFYTTSALFSNNRPTWAQRASNMKEYGKHTFFNV